MTNPYTRYSNNQLENALPGAQIGALFDKAAEHISNAAKAIREGDVQARYDYSEKSMAIMEGLLSCLNRETPERAAAAESLEAYYQSMITMIGRINIFNDLAVCNSLEKSFKDMAQFWREADAHLSVPQTAVAKSVQIPA